jgi:N-acetyl-anhydromuramyl-L-alanine amidase AmpD
MILRKGSKGEEVRKLQELLGLFPDGSFGNETEKAVQAFQKLKGLTVDGIVGPKTWEALTSTNNKCVDPSVIYMPLGVHITKLPNRPIRYLAIHFTAGSSSIKGAASKVKQVFETRNASADFCVDDDTMVQFNPDLNNYYCWAVGDKKNSSSGGGLLYAMATNKNTISIEICSTLEKGTTVQVPNHKGWSFTNKAIDKAIKLSKILMKRFNIPLERVVRHYDISGKLCPGIIGWNNGPLYNTTGTLTNNKNNSTEWLKFKEALKNP